MREQKLYLVTLFIHFFTVTNYGKIPSIKHFRYGTGAGLKEAKDFLEDNEGKHVRVILTDSQIGRLFSAAFENQYKTSAVMVNHVEEYKQPKLTDLTHFS